MKKPTNYALLALLITLLTLGCSLNSESPTVPNINADQFASTQDVVNTLRPEEQIFTITDHSIMNTITGMDGTIITVQPNAFIAPDNTTITTPITAHLTEFLTVENIVRGNAQTISNGQLLVTGGSFYLIFKDENEGRINAIDGSLSASIPIQTDITGFEDQMQYYIGQCITAVGNLGNCGISDTRTAVDWELSNSSESSVSNNTFNIFNLEQGLSNCDVLYDMAGETGTQFEVSVANVTDYSNCMLWMIIDDFPSAITINSLDNNQNILRTFSGSIPLGLNATLIAITTDNNNYLHFGSLDITVSGDDVFNVDISNGTIEELQELIHSVTN